MSHDLTLSTHISPSLRRDSACDGSCECKRRVHYSFLSNIHIFSDPFLVPLSPPATCVCQRTPIDPPSSVSTICHKCTLLTQAAKSGFLERITSGPRVSLCGLDVTPTLFPHPPSHPFIIRPISTILFPVHSFFLHFSSHPTHCCGHRDRRRACAGIATKKMSQNNNN